VHAQPVQLLQTAAVDLQHLEARCDVPDVDEGDVSKLHAPFHGDADSVQQGVDHVAEVLAAVEAAVGVAPHAVHRADALRLRKDVLEPDLKMVIDVVGVTVDEINFSHGDGYISAAT